MGFSKSSSFFFVLFQLFCGCSIISFSFLVFNLIFHYDMHVRFSGDHLLVSTKLHKKNEPIFVLKRSILLVVVFCVSYLFVMHRHFHVSRLNAQEF